jgi:hypothetical protein
LCRERRDPYVTNRAVVTFAYSLRVLTRCCGALVVALFGSTERDGRLRLRPRALCISLFGNVDLDCAKQRWKET